MEKLWIYLVLFLAGFTGGVITGVKLMGDQISVTVRKIKNKKTTGTNEVTIPIDIERKRRIRRKTNTNLKTEKQ